MNRSEVETMLHKINDVCNHFRATTIAQILCTVIVIICFIMFLNSLIGFINFIKMPWYNMFWFIGIGFFTVIVVACFNNWKKKKYFWKI